MGRMAHIVASVPESIGVAALLAYALAGGIAAVLAGYQLMLAAAAFFHRPVGPTAGRQPRLVVVVPAHDECELIGRCVTSLRSQTYAAEHYDIIVIADNCTDATASLAAEAGAEVLVRTDPQVRGKGHALRWAFDRILDRTPAPHAIVVVDADSEADPGFLAAIVDRLESGASAVQGESLLAPNGSPQSALRAAAFLLVNRTRPSGRSALGAGVTLAGNGMAFARKVLIEHPWEAFTSAEDVEYTLRLRLRKVRVEFAAGAILRSPTAPNPRAAAEQQLRWEGGKLHLARTWVPKLAAAALRERRPGLLEAAFELAVPPLGLLAAIAAAAAAAGSALVLAGGLPLWPVLPWLIALAAIPLYVLVGLRAARAPAWAYRSIAHAPLYVLTKLLRVHRTLRFRGDTWLRTERASEEQHAG